MAAIQIEVTVSGDANQARDAVKDRLEVLPLVQDATVDIGETKQGFGEAATIILGTIVLLKLGTAAVAQFRLLLRELAGLQRDLTGAQSIIVTIDGEKLDPSKVDDDKLIELVAKLSANG